jgi:hypothetical protein
VASSKVNVYAAHERNAENLDNPTVTLCGQLWFTLDSRFFLGEAWPNPIAFEKSNWLC